MITASNPAFQPSDADLKRLNRAMVWSVGLHVLIVATMLVMPREWIAKPPDKVLTISLGGAIGPRTTGTSNIGGRTVEQVAPPPKRAEPIRPIPQAQPAPSPVKPMPQASKPTDTSKAAPVTPTRPVTTGPEVTRGTSRVDTGAKGEGFGLASGGGTGGETDLRNFCCPDYLMLLSQRIDASWELAGKRQPEKGLTIVRFTLKRDGSVDPSSVQIVQPSGSNILDRAARTAITSLKMNPLPAAFPDSTLTVRVNFPYEGN
jgi:TonB family protein